MANFLSPTQHHLLAKAIDKHIGLPFVSDKREYDICLKIARTIDTAVEARLPDELLAGLNTPDIQVEKMIADAMKENLVPLLADLLSFPFLPTTIKMRMLDFVVELLCDAMASATSLDETIEEFLNA